jgi:NAD(P)-dependent dehydrogenase (short-subunit alcohol dehydrogenase family)
MADTSDRNAVVTGAAGGMGRAIIKTGVHMFTETLREELAETAIRVTELQPGLTRTNIILTRYRGDRKQ